MIESKEIPEQKGADAASAASTGKHDFFLYFLVATTLVLVIYARVRLLPAPLERDEGEFAYMGQLLIKGFPPYSHAYTLKLPGVSAVYAFFMLLLGQSIIAIHMGLLLVNILCVLLVFLLAKHFQSTQGAIISCTSYAVLSLSSSVMGVYAHATHFVVLFVLAGLLLLLRALEHYRLPLFFGSGICIGLAILMKQHALAFAAFAAFYLAWYGFRMKQDKQRHLKCVLFFIAGAVSPYLLLLLIIWQTGNFPQFWFWTVEYARVYVSEATIREAFSNLYEEIVAMQPLYPLLLLALAGIIAFLKRSNRGGNRVFVLGLLIFSLVSVIPGFYFRRHYFVMLLPSLAVLAGTGTIWAGRLFREGPFQKLMPAALLAGSIAFAFWLDWDYTFRLPPVEVTRRMYIDEAFARMPQVANYLKALTSPKDRIAVVGSEPELFYYTDRISATGYIYLYGILENQRYSRRMESEMIREIEATVPRFIVVDNIALLNLGKTSPDSRLSRWLDLYLREHYQLAGGVETRREGSFFFWRQDPSKIGLTAKTLAFITIFQRKD